MWNQVRPIKLVPLEEDRHCVLYICPGDFAEQCRLKTQALLAALMSLLAAAVLGPCVVR